MTKREMDWIQKRATQIAYAVYYGEPAFNNVQEMAGWMRNGDSREPQTPSHTREWHAGWQAARIWCAMIHPESEKPKERAKLGRKPKRRSKRKHSGNWCPQCAGVR